MRSGCGLWVVEVVAEVEVVGVVVVTVESATTGAAAAAV